MKRAIFAVLLLAAPAWAAAQTCTTSMTLHECWGALNSQASGRASQNQKDTATKVAAAANPVNTGSQTGTSTATDDFNPKFQVSADSLGVTGDSGGGLTLSWSDLLGQAVFGPDRSFERAGQQHKLTVKLEQAELFEPLSKAITDTAVKDELRGSLGDFDDVLADFRLSLDALKYGRNLQRQGTLIDAIQAATQKPLQSQIDEMLSNTDVEDALVQKYSLDPDKRLNTALNELDAQQVIAATQTAWTSVLGYVEAYESNARKNGLFDLVDLVNNQPQLVLSVQSRIRDDLVGPNESALKFSYELGGANVNAFRRYQAEQQAREAPEAAQAAAAQSVAAAATEAAKESPTNAAAVAAAASAAATAAAAAAAAKGADATAVGAVSASIARAATTNPADADGAAAAGRAVADAELARVAALRACATVVACLQRYVAREKDAIRAGNRLAFSLAFVSKDSYHYDQHGVLLDLPSARSLVAQFTYGRYVGTRNLAGILGGRRSRIDIAASFEDVKDDPTRQNRAVANITFAQEVSRGLFLTVGFAWANKPEFRGAVDTELSARAGISYKLAPREE